MIAPILAGLVLSSTAVQAQNAIGTIPARARVGSTIALGPVTELDFGAIIPGATATVDPGYAADIPHAGSIEVSYTNGSITLDVLIEEGDELRAAPGGVALDVALTCAVGFSATDAAPTTVACEGETFDVTTHPSGTTAWIFVGGSAAAPVGAPSGLYQGAVTVRVSIVST